MSNDLLENLAGEGALAARGEFQLDQSKAREKMEQFQLVDPYHYILELVQGAHLLGATEINFTIDADELEMVFDGDALTVEELDDIYSAAFSREPDDRVQARRHFAIALTAIGALGAAEVRLTMPRGAAAAQLLVEGETETVSSTERWKPVTRNRFYVKEKFRLGHLLEFFDAIKDNHVESELIRQRCKYASTKITVNGQQVSQGHHLSKSASHIVDVEWDHDRGLLGVRTNSLRGGRESSDIRLIQNGVWITSVSLEADFISVEAIIETSKLTKNLSQSAFVEDDLFRTLIHDVLRGAMYESMDEWVKRVKVDSSNYDALRSVATSVWSHVSEQKFAPTSPAGRLARSLERLPVWPNACKIDRAPDVFTFGAAQMIHLRALVDGGPDNPILWAQRRYHTISHDRPIFLKRPDTSYAFDVIGAYTRREWKQADEKLQTLEDHERNRQRWNMRPWSDPSLALHPYRFSLRLHGFEVELLSVTERSQGIVLVHVHDGRVLNSGRIPQQLPAAMVVIKGSFEVNDTFDAPLRTPELEAVYRALISRLPDVWRAVATDEGLTEQVDVQRQLAICALQFVTGTYANFALKAFGFGESVSTMAIELMADEDSPDIIRVGSLNGKQDKALARIEALGEIADARIVATSTYPVTLREIVENARDNTVWTADLKALPRFNHALKSWDKWPIVDESYPWGYLVDTLYGSTTDALYHLKRETARNHFLKRETRDYWKLLEHPRYAIGGIVSGDGWSARWGARGAGAKRGTVQCVWNDRSLLTQETNIQVGTIDVTVRGDRITPNESFDGLFDRSWFDDMRAAVAHDFARSIGQLADRAHNPESRGLQPSEVELLWNTMAAANADNNGLGKLRFVRDTTGGSYNARAISSMAQDGPVYWVHEGRDLLSELVPSGKPVIELPSVAVLTHLASLAGGRDNLVEVTRSEATAKLVEQSRARFRQRRQRLMRVPYALVSKTQETDSFALLAGLLAVSPATPTTSELVICREMRVVSRLGVTTPFARFEFVYNDDQIRLDPSWEAPIGDFDHVQQLALDLGEQLVLDYLQQVEAAPTEATRKRVIHWARVGIKDRENTSITWPEAWSRLENFPLFVMPGLGRVSIAELRENATTSPIRYLTPGESSRDIPGGFVLADADELFLLGDLFGDDLQHARPKHESARADSPESGSTPRYQPPDTTGDSGIIPVWEIEPERPLPRDVIASRTDSEILIDSLRELIRRTSANADDVLSDKYIEAMNLWGNDPRRIARVTADKVSVMTDHVLTKYALDDLDDPVRRTLMASALLTVINHHYEDVDENDESSLQLQLLADMIGARNNG